MIYLLFAGCSATAGAGRPGFAPLGSCVLHCLGQQAGEEGEIDLAASGGGAGVALHQGCRVNLNLKYITHMKNTLK